MRAKIGRVATASGLALVVGELITLAQVIALARLLTPAEVGIYAAGTILTVFLGDMAEGGLRSAVIQRHGDIDDAVATTFWATLFNGVLLSLGALMAAPIIGWIFDSRAIALVAAVTSGSLLVLALTNVPEALLQRRFSALRGFIVGPAMSLVFGVVAVVTAASGWGVWSMVAGSYASYAVAVVGLWLLCDWRPGRGRFSFTLWRELARFGFPLIVMMLGYRVKNMLESVIIGRRLGESGLGQYRYAQRIGQIPVRAIINIGGVALFPAFARISGHGDKERLRAAYLRAIRWAMIAAAPLTALMISVGLPSVVVVLGEQWREAGAVVVAMAGVGVGRALESVSQEAIKGAGRTSLIHWCTAVEVVGGLVLVLSLIGPFGLRGVGLAASITAIVVGTMYVFFARAVIGVETKPLLRAIIPPLPAAAIACAVTFYLERNVFHSDSHAVPAAVGLLLADVLIFGAAYFAALSAIEPKFAPQFAEVVLRLARRLAPGQRRENAGRRS
jgi:PST family polysaccharide transporter